MKYSKACTLKKQLNLVIEKLSRTVVGPGVTNVVRIILAVAHVSVILDSVHGIDLIY